MGILDEMQQQQTFSELHLSLGDALTQLQQLKKVEYINLSMFPLFIILAATMGAWVIPFISLFIPSAFYPPLTGMATKLTDAQRKHFYKIIWAHCAVTASPALFFVLGIAVWGVGINSNFVGFMMLILAVIAIAMSFYKLRVYAKTAKAIKQQRKNIA